MAFGAPTLESRFAALERALADVRMQVGAGPSVAIGRWLADAAAMRFHLSRKVRTDGAGATIVVVLGGTGTGKSTLVNRLLGSNVSAASFRRTFTSGPIAFVGAADRLPEGWLDLPHAAIAAGDLPARGRTDQLLVALAAAELTRTISLIDTPDLDGDQPPHHALADRAFRWCDAAVFLVTPEKYQMTELLPYYRLAQRYVVPALFVMNKCEQTEMLEDYARLLASRGEDAAVQPFAIPRDDAAYEPPADRGLAALREAMGKLRPAEKTIREAGLAHRAADLVGRLTDQVIAPLREDRREAERLSASLKAMETPEPGVDVNPLTQQLQRRMQQRSVLYLMGPGRMLDRARQVPGLLVRLPRTLWDVVIGGKGVRFDDPRSANAGGTQGDAQVPDFRVALMDQFTVVQSRIDDVLRSSPAASRWLEQGAQAEASYQAALLDREEAGKIADEELAEMKDWLEKRWNATPRDTMLLMKLLRYLPGGERLAKWTEAAPYLLAIIVATHHALFGPVDLAVVGGFSIAAWLTEKLSNEVANHTRAANRRIAERFGKLAHQQIDRVRAWLDEQAPEIPKIDALQRLADEIAGEVKADSINQEANSNASG